jgi:hypothetical protein
LKQSLTEVFEMMTALPERDFHSLGAVARQTGALPHTVEAAAEATGIKPAICLNGVAYFSREQVQALADAIHASAAAKRGNR